MVRWFRRLTHGRVRAQSRWILGPLMLPGRASAGPVLRSQGGSREGSLSRCARGVWVIASNARFSPVPLTTLGRVTRMSHRGLFVHR
jgi:hypothetical protein